MLDDSKPLSEFQRKTLNLVAQYQFEHGTHASADAVLLEFPPQAGENVAATLADLVRDGLLEGDSRGYGLTTEGLFSSRRGGDAALIAESLLGFFSLRLREEKTAFRKFDWEDLKRREVVKSDDDFGLTLALISILRLSQEWTSSLGPPPTASWRVPRDVVALRAVTDVSGLLQRLDALRASEFRPSAALAGAPPGQNLPTVPSVGEMPRAEQPSLFGDWRVWERLGSGGQGTASRCVHAKTGEVGVIKVLNDRHRDDPNRWEKALARFRHEVRIIQGIKHQCVLRVLDADLDSAEPWVVTEYMPMGSLQGALRLLKGDAWRVLRIARDIACALAEVHSHKVIHRDVKPANILLRSLDHAVLGDFGIAHISDATEVTSTDEHVAAKWFGPPEADGGRIDQPDATFDVYSLGKVIYTALRGGERFMREGFRKESSNLVSLLNRPDLESVNRLLDQMIVAESDGRFPDMEAVTRGIDSTIAELFGLAPADQCRACRSGKYEPGTLKVDGGGSVALWLAGGNGDRLFTEICSICGDVRFSAESKRNTWNQTRRK